MSEAPPQTRVQAAWIELRDAVNEEWLDNEMIASERMKSIFKLARGLYRRHNPYSYLTGIGNPVSTAPLPTRNGNGWEVVGPFRPAWATYINEATALLDLMDELEK